MSDNGLLEEFVFEAGELLDEAEDALLSIEKGNDLEANFNSVFRVFHSLKGSAGMIGFDAVQKHMHLIEDRFEMYKSNLDGLKDVTGFFLEAVDHGRLLLEGQQAEFNYNLQKEELLESGGEVQTEDGPVTIDDVFVVDLIGSDLKSVPSVQSLSSQIQFNEIVDTNIYIKKRQYFHANAIIASASEYEKIKANLKDEIPVIIVGESGAKSSTILIEKAETMSAQDLVCSVSHSKVIMKSLFLLDKAIKFIFYQYTDLDKYLEQDKRGSIRTSMQEEIKNIINLKGELFK